MEANGFGAYHVVDKLLYKICRWMMPETQYVFIIGEGQFQDSFWVLIGEGSCERNNKYNLINSRRRRHWGLFEDSPVT